MDVGKKAPIANPGFHDEKSNLYLMWFGPYGEVKVFVWADHFEEAFHEAVEWLSETPWAPYHFAFMTEADLKEAARDLGIPWQPHWPESGAISPTFARVIEQAEVDLTPVGSGFEHGEYIASWGWGGNQVPVGRAIYDVVLKRSKRETPWKER